MPSDGEDVSRLGSIVVRELREALPATLFFFVLFHLLALTKAVALGDHDFTALHAFRATVGALIVAKAILLVEALPLPRALAPSRMARIAWKTMFYGLVVLAFQFLEEVLHLASREGSLARAAGAVLDEVSWPFFGVLALWIVAGLLLYALLAEMVRAIGSDRVKELLAAPATEEEA